jgi:hypothetical protein
LERFGSLLYLVICLWASSAFATEFILLGVSLTTRRGLRSTKTLQKTAAHMLGMASDNGISGLDFEKVA